MNPLDIGVNPLEYDYSSLGYFLGDKNAEWLHPEHLVASSEEADEYAASLNSAAEYHELHNQLKSELAN
jgi:hypothetical protein